VGRFDGAIRCTAVQTVANGGGGRPELYSAYPSGWLRSWPASRRHSRQHDQKYTVDLSVNPESVSWPA
jgi:hypothetical protein